MAFLESAIDDILSATIRFGTEQVALCALQIENVATQSNANLCGNQLEHAKLQQIVATELVAIGNLEMLRYMHQKVLSARELDRPLFENWWQIVHTLQSVGSQHSVYNTIEWTRKNNVNWNMTSGTRCAEYGHLDVFLWEQAEYFGFHAWGCAYGTNNLRYSTDILLF